MTRDLKYFIDKKFRLLKDLRTGIISQQAFAYYHRISNSAIVLAKVMWFMMESLKNSGDFKKTGKNINSFVNGNNKRQIFSLNDMDGFTIQKK